MISAVSDPKTAFINHDTKFSSPIKPSSINTGVVANHHAAGVATKKLKDSGDAMRAIAMQVNF